MKGERRLGNQLAAINRMARLWKQQNRVMSLQGIISPDQKTIMRGEEKATALAKHWEPVFAAPKVQQQGSGTNMFLIFETMEL